MAPKRLAVNTNPPAATGAVGKSPAATERVHLSVSSCGKGSDVVSDCAASPRKAVQADFSAPKGAARSAFGNTVKALA